MTDFEPVVIGNPIFDPTKPEWILVLPDGAEEYCFTIKAVDDAGVISYPSNEIGRGTTCGQIVNHGSRDESAHVQNASNAGGSRGSGNGTC